MGQPAAKQGDLVVATDTHLIQPPGSSPPVPVPGHPFSGVIQGALSPDVNVMGKPAATVQSTANNQPPHIPLGGTFVKPPSNQATIVSGSTSVFINGKAAARSGDPALTCNDPADLPVGTVQAVGTVNIGG